MELLLRGKYVLTSAAEPCVVTDAAVRVRGDIVAEIGDWDEMRRAYPDARVVVGNGRALPVPGGGWGARAHLPTMGAVPSENGRLRREGRGHAVGKRGRRALMSVVVRSPGNPGQFTSMALRKE